MSADCPTVIADPPTMHRAASDSFKWFVIAAIITWAACALWPVASMLAGRLTGWPAGGIMLAFAVYGAAMFTVVWAPRRPSGLSERTAIALASVQAFTSIFINWASYVYLHGTGMALGLVVIVAAQLPYFLSRRTVWLWIGAQTVALTLLLQLWSLEGLMFGVAALGFQIFAVASSMLVISEGRARMHLSRTNAELTATRELLAENSRTAERLRISRDLHDTLGHHLTALSLQLDVAARLSDGKAADHIQQAHAITRLLLGDVRDVVSTLRESSKLNLAEAIKALAAQPSQARVHLDMPDRIELEDSARAEAILRAVQEVLTNTARHAMANNLWLRLELSADGLTLVARDDGRGATAMTWGNGLRGMRERFEQFGGHVGAGPSADGGFEVRAFMPLPPPA